MAVHDEYSRQAQATYAGHAEVSYLVRGGHVDVLEGDWQPQCFFVIPFDDREKATAWYRSPAYQEVKKLRQQSAESNLIMVEAGQ